MKVSTKTYPGSWPGGPNKESFEQTCIRLSNNLLRFKQDPHFVSVIGNDVRPEHTAKLFYNFLKEKDPYLLEPGQIENILKNDLVGNPKIYSFNGLEISSGTLIFMKVLSEIRSLKKINSIIEIGSGYGGQCCVIKSLLDVEYTCVDNVECLRLCEVYLNQVGINAQYMNSSEINPMNSDLVISNYCISELDEKGIDFYFENIVNKSNNFYFAVGNYKINSTTHKHLLERSREKFKVKIIPENPKTSKHDNIIIIGVKN